MPHNPLLHAWPTTHSCMPGPLPTPACMPHYPLLHAPPPTPACLAHPCMQNNPFFAMPIQPESVVARIRNDGDPLKGNICHSNSTKPTQLCPCVRRLCVWIFMQGCMCVRAAVLCVDVHAACSVVCVCVRAVVCVRGYACSMQCCMCVQLCMHAPP